MDLVGHDDLQSRSAYQPVIHKQGARWIAYVGHHGGMALNPLTGKQEPNGTSIVDVTDPKHPQYLFAHSRRTAWNAGAGAETGGAQMVRVCDGSDLPHADKSKVYLLRPFGMSAEEIWDVTNPAKPSRLTVVVSGLRDSHKSWWECDSGIAYLVGGAPGWRAKRMTHDLRSERSGQAGVHPQFWPAGPAARLDGPGAERFARPDLHRAERQSRVLCLRPGGDGTIQIVDREKLLNGPKEPTDENLRYPQIARVDLPPAVGAHTAFPLLGVELSGIRQAKSGKVGDFLLVPGETFGNECLETRQMVRIFDITTESKPLAVSTWTVPGGQRQLLQPRRALRHAFHQRKLHADLLQARGVPLAFQCRRARPGCSRSVSSEGNWLLHPGHHRQDR